MKAEVQRRLIWGVPLAMMIAALAIPHCATPPAPLSRSASPDGTRFGLAPSQRRTFFNDIVAGDARWRGLAESSFPGDDWAQADHWTDHFSQHVRLMASQYGVSVVQILLAYDEGLHEGWRGPGKKRLPADWPPLTRRRR